MSTEPESTTPAATPPAAATPAMPPRPNSTKLSLWRYIFLGQSKSDEFAVYHHSSLFYWWPVWLFGFIFAGATYFSEMRMIVVPAGSHSVSDRIVLPENNWDKPETRNIVVLPPGKEFPKLKIDGAEEIMQPRYAMSPNKGYGALFVIVLLLVTIITNISMRGLWSFLVLIVLVMVALLATAAGWWETILARVGLLAVYINLAGYLTIASVLFVFWLIGLFIFDRQTYMIFTPGQVRLCLEIGGGETVYDTTGMVVQKQRGDLFRHWVLGFGSGDLVVRPVGLANPIELTNVLRVAKVVKIIESMTKARVVLSQPAKKA